LVDAVVVVIPFKVVEVVGATILFPSVLAWLHAVGLFGYG
jgi:hypothetical protein